MKVGPDKNILDPNSISFEEREKQIEDEKEREKEQQKRKKQSPYSNWYQFNRDHSDKMIWLATNHPKAQAILLFLLDQMDDYNAVICSYQVLQETLGIAQATIARSIKVLKERGFIAIYKSGTSNVYIINDELAWGSWGNNREYCKFPANVILSATENQEYKNKISFDKLKQITSKTKETEGQNYED